MTMNTEDAIVDVFLMIGIIGVFVLKITNVITIPWVWLLSPLWIIGGAIVLLMIVITIIYLLEESVRRKKNERNKNV